MWGTERLSTDCWGRLRLWNRMFSSGMKSLARSLGRSRNTLPVIQGAPAALIANKLTNVRSMALVGQGAFKVTTKPSMASVSSLAGGIIRREMTTSGHSKALKTKKAASKRFIRTGKGGLKRGKANKGHLTSKKSPDRKRRLNLKTQLTGAVLKKMRGLILTGK